MEGDGCRFEGERDSKRLRIEGPVSVVDYERSTAAIAQSGPLVLEFWKRADGSAKANQRARRSRRDRQRAGPGIQPGERGTILCLDVTREMVDACLY